MTNSDVKSVVDYIGGYQYVIGFRFANGYKLTYSPRKENDTSYQFKEEDLLEINGVDYLKFKHHDHENNPAYSIIPTECINQVYYMTDAGICFRDIME